MDAGREYGGRHGCPKQGYDISRGGSGPYRYEEPLGHPRQHELGQDVDGIWHAKASDGLGTRPISRPKPIDDNEWARLWAAADGDIGLRRPECPLSIFDTA